jgi:fructan beta-fructosidase
MLMKPLHSLLFFILLLTSAAVAQSVEPTPTMYQEPYRPQVHYSSLCGWVNDPNGMVYYEGEYHLFYQLNPKALVPGAMHWGHAVSPDLVHWQTLPIALYPDEIGPIWSGSVVVDADNTSGLVPGGGLIAIYSYENQSQGIAYSADKGRTWTMYAGNPVIPALAKDFRDPKVFWHEATGQWSMVLSVGPEVQFFTSPDLINWEFASRFTGGHRAGVWEVPDIFSLEIDGETKWVLLVSVSTLAPAGGGGIQYFIGDFDGKTFTPDSDSPILWLDYGPDNYAGTTWNNLPDDQRTYIGWMSNWQYAAATPTSVWRGAMTLPREFRLVRTDEGLRLAQAPVSAVSELRETKHTWEKIDVEGELVLDDVQGRTLEIIAEIQPESAERFGIAVQRGTDSTSRIIYNAQQEQLLISRSDETSSGAINNFNPAFGAPVSLKDRPLKLHIFVDESSIEVFAKDGLVSLTGLTFADPADTGVALFAENGSVQFTSLEIHTLSSIWTEEYQPFSTDDYCQPE